MTRAVLQAWEAFAEATLTRQPEAAGMGRELTAVQPASVPAVTAGPGKAVRHREHLLDASHTLATLIDAEQDREAEQEKRS